jgi:TRAP-type C4-dicarboxylate transport system substrate-binding protein
MRTTPIKLLMGAVASAAVLMGSATAQDLPATKLKIIGPPLNTPNWLTVVQPMMEDVKKASNGKVVLEGQSLTELNLKGPEVIRMGKIGVADVIAASSAYASGEVPEMDGIDPSGLVQTIPELRKVTEAYRPVIDRIFQERLSQKLLVMWPTGSQIVWCATPVDGIDGLQGKKIRVYSAGLSQFFAAVGAVPTSLAFAEVVPAMQRKVVDCGVTGANSGNLAKWTDVATHVFPLNVGWSVNMLSINVNSWKKLDPRVQKFLMDQAEAAAERGWAQAQESSDHGVWCSVGDSRCNVKASAPKEFIKANLKLVEESPTDAKKRLAAVEKSVLADFAKRCGKACADEWTNTVGKIYGIKAVAN